MRYGIFSDVHSNLEAMEIVELALKSEKVDECFCLGDIVGYGANPSECIAKVKKISSVIIAGNHDWAVAGKFDIENFNQDAKDAILWTHRNLSIEDKRFLFNLPLIYKENDFTLIHGTLLVPEDFDYALDVSGAGENLKIQDTAFCFVGHSHIPEIYVSNDGIVSRYKPGKINPNFACLSGRQALAKFARRAGQLNPFGFNCARPAKFVEFLRTSPGQSSLRKQIDQGRGNPDRLSIAKFGIRADKCLVNVGSVGQPRDTDARAAYCIFDSDKKIVSIKRVKYNIKKAQGKILAAGLPPLFACRLLEGK